MSLQFIYNGFDVEMDPEYHNSTAVKHDDKSKSRK